MRFILPFASAYSAIRGHLTRSMSSVHNTDDSTIRGFLREVYQKSKPRNVMSVFVTGGGCTSLEWLFTVPGASRCLMDGGVVYSRSALDAFLRSDEHTSASSCSAGIALTMADASWRHASEYLLAESRDFNDLRDSLIFGVSCSASLQSDVPKKGPHRVYVASTMQSKSDVFTLELNKGQRTRVDEDTVCSRVILEAIASTTGVKPLVTDYLTVNGNGDTTQQHVESIAKTTIFRDDVFERIYRKEVHQAIFVKKHVQDRLPSGDDFDIHDHFVILEDAKLPKGSLVFPGSFNPLHEGHVALVVAALRKLSTSAVAHHNDNCTSGGSPSSSQKSASFMPACDSWKNIPVVFEIAAVNADKPPIPRDEIIRRVMQFDPFVNEALLAAGLTNVAVCVTSEPLFLQKSKLFRDCNFLIGSDTMARIINPKYYYAEPAEEGQSDLSVEGKARKAQHLEEQRAYAMVSALSTVVERGCTFVVGGRTANLAGAVDEAETFQTLESICEASAVNLPSTLLSTLFQGLSEEEFRVDLSSTQLRNKG